MQLTIPFKALLALSLWIIISSCGKPMARFSVVDETTKAPATVQFENQSKKAKTYAWDFGNGNSSTEEHPSCIYNLSGKYKVTLTASNDQKSHSSTKTIYVEAPKSCQVLLETIFGNMVIELSDLTPQHRDNFIELADKGFYNDLLFHRIIDGFMIQGGDPDSRDAAPGTPLGSGGPGYQVPAEFRDELLHVKGAIAAARMGDQVNPDKKSSGSQFYIVHGGEVSDDMLDRLEGRNGLTYTEEQRALYKEIGGTPFLDGGYTVFGRIISGMEVIDMIAEVQTAPGDRPLEDVLMSIKVIH